MDGFENARRRIEEYQRNRPQIIYCMVPTGPTERLFKSSNRIIIDSS